MDPVSTEAAVGTTIRRRKRAGATIQSLETSGVPRGILGVLEALQFEGARTSRLHGLGVDEWQMLLSWCDRRQLTLMLPEYCGDALPIWVQERISGTTVDFEKRLLDLKADLFEIARSLGGRGLEFVVLKGITHAPTLTPSALWRAQGDIDLWLNGESVYDAQDALIALGYVSTSSGGPRHLAPLVRPIEWQWRGNLAEVPVGIELHHTLWSRNAEYINISGQHEFWERRETRFFDGHALDVLRREDLLAFAAVHLFLHLIHGDLPLQRSWEIANFLHYSANDEPFWNNWKQLQPPDLRQIQTVVFAIVNEWFACRLPECVEEAELHLPDNVRLWLDRFALSPLKSQFRPNKDDLWLHLALIDSFREKVRVFARRLVPLNLSPLLKWPSANTSAQNRVPVIRETGFVAARVRHHAITFLPTVANALKWVWIKQSFSPGFPRFLCACALFDVGEFLFLLLYNLYLLDRGFNESALGMIAGAMTLGTLAGTPIAAYFARSVGLRKTLIVAAIGGGVTTVARVVIVGPLGLAASAFLNGMFFSCWAVAFCPVVASMSPEKNRPLAFSLVTSIGISIGVVVGIGGSHLPSVFEHGPFLLSSLASKQICMAMGSALIALAAIPAAGLAKARLPERAARIYPRGRFIWHFLIAIFIWIAATSSFNSFFTAYFSRRIHFGLEQIGFVFSAGQLFQIAAILLAPVVIRKFGEAGGIAAMQVATALMLALLALGPTQIASVAYIGYVSFQYMSEPGLFSLLMNRVSPGERTGASSMMFLAMSLAGSIATVAAGTAIAKAGYAISLSVGVCLAVLSAILFRFLPAAMVEDSTMRPPA